MRILTVVLLLVEVVLCGLTVVTLAGPPGHIHQRKLYSQLNRERVEDGFLAHQQGGHDVQFDHNAILGSHREAEEFQKLSPDEAKKRLEILIRRRIDLNGDGLVEREELNEWIKKSFEALTMEEANEEFLDADVDQDGKVSWREHLKEFYEDDEDIQSVDEVLQEDRDLWKTADQDGDGLLAREEYIAFYSPEEFPRMHPVLYDHAMRRRDKDSDGLISLDEFLTDSNGQPLDPKSEHYVQEKQEFTETHDRDRSGFLEREEIMTWIAPTDIEIAKDETDHLMENTDDDRDGLLSVDEILAHHDLWVGSEATDFGQHLHNPHYIDEL